MGLDVHEWQNQIVPPTANIAESGDYHLTEVQKQIRIECDKLAEDTKNWVKKHYAQIFARAPWFFATPEMMIRADLDDQLFRSEINESTITILLVLLRACRISTDFEIAISPVCGNIAEMLIEKNRAYGNSALSPIRKFSKASNVEQILVRIDDKLSRLARGEAAGEDVEKDLIGYLVLLRIARNGV